MDSNNYRLAVVVGNEASTVWLDDVEFMEGGGPPVYLREFENGLVILNDSESTVDVPLWTVYQRLSGTQDPVVNDGAVTDTETIGPRDGRILLSVE